MKDRFFLPARHAIAPHDKHIIDYGKQRHDYEVVMDVGKCVALRHYHPHHLYKIFYWVEVVDEFGPFWDATNRGETLIHPP